MKHTKSLTLLVPVMFTFFTMGFVDLVGIATNYVKEDFTLSDTMANLLPSMVFLWCLARADIQNLVKTRWKRVANMILLKIQ